MKALSHIDIIKSHLTVVSIGDVTEIRRSDDSTVLSINQPLSSLIDGFNSTSDLGSYLIQISDDGITTSQIQVPENTPTTINSLVDSVYNQTSPTGIAYSTQREAFSEAHPNDLPTNPPEATTPHHLSPVFLRLYRKEYTVILISVQP